MASLRESALPMVSPPPSVSSPSRPLLNGFSDSAQAPLNELARLSGMTTDVISLRRAVAVQQRQSHEKSEPANPISASEGAESEEVWSQRFGDAVRALGIPLRRIETSGDLEWGRFEGCRAAVTCVSTSPPVWALVEATNGAPQVRLYRQNAAAPAASSASHESWGVLVAAISRSGRSTMHWTVLDPMLLNADQEQTGLGESSHGSDGGGHGSAVAGGHGSHPTPLQRLMTLIRLEWSDIWIVLVFSFVVGVLSLAIPVAVESLVNTVAFGQFLQPVVILSIVLFVFLLFAALLRALQIYVVEIIQRRMFVRLAGVVAWRTPRVWHESADSSSLRELTNRFFDIVTVQKSAAMLLLDGLALVLGAIVGMSVLAFYHPWLLGFDVVLLSLVTFAILVLGRGAVPTAIEESRAKYDTVSWFEQVAAAEVTFKSPAAADLALSRADRLVSQYLTKRKQHFRIVLRQSLFALFLQALASTVLLGMGGWLVIMGQLTLGQLVAAELIVTVIVGSFAKFGKHMETYYDLLASLSKIGHLTDVPVERSPGIARLPHGGAASVQLSAVAYRFPGHLDHSGLPPVTLDAPAGSFIAVAGSSGSGKSTLLELLYGLRLPQQGVIRLDGTDLRDIETNSLRQSTALVRGVEAFEGTIEENLLMGRADCSDDAIREALRDADLLPQVQELPAGRGTRLLESGAPLSTGLLLRLMIARALVGRPRLLLIDGTLDALPDDAAARIWDRLRDRRMTVFVVTGRREFAERCDQRLTLATGGNQH